MRKLLWLGAAALFSGLCGICYYAAEYPGSVVAQTTKSMVALSNQVNPLARMMASGQTRSIATTTGSTDSKEDTIAPADPRPMATRAASHVRAIDLGSLATVGSPVPVTVHSNHVTLDADMEVVVAPAPSEGPVQGQVANQTVAFFEEATPRVMPHATDEDEGPNDATGPSQPLHLERSNYVGNATAKYPNVDLESGSTKKSSGETTTLATAPISAAQMELSVPFHDYHAQMMVCPYTGRCLEMPKADPNPSTDKKVDVDACEESEMELCGPPDCEEQEPPLPHISRKPNIPTLDEENHPCHPEVDTMEYRPTDGNLRETKTGPV